MVLEQNKFKEPRKTGYQTLRDDELVRIVKSGAKKQKKQKAIDEIARRLRKGRQVRGLKGLTIPGFHDRVLLNEDPLMKQRKENLAKGREVKNEQNGS